MIDSIINDDKTFGLFKALYVDGKKLSDSDFSVEAGSIVATLKKHHVSLFFFVAAEFYGSKVLLVLKPICK